MYWLIAFGNVMAMEYQSGSWYLLCATKQGRKKSIVRKGGLHDGGNDHVSASNDMSVCEYFVRFKSVA